LDDTLKPIFGVYGQSPLDEPVIDDAVDLDGDTGSRLIESLTYSSRNKSSAPNTASSKKPTIDTYDLRDREPNTRANKAR
jgi:hypothetical protein